MNRLRATVIWALALVVVVCTLVLWYKYNQAMSNFDL